MKQMEEFINELKEAQDLEQMVEVENKIAGYLGTGFLRGEFHYPYLLQIKEEVDRIETEHKEKFQEKAAEQKRHVSHAR